jgi:hypothetical protein
MLKDDQLSKIKYLRVNGYSINKITNLLGIKKSTLYYHVRKDFGRFYKKATFHPYYKQELGEFIGAFAGDGSLVHHKKYGYRIRFYFGGLEFEYAKHLKQIINKIFNKESCIRFEKNKYEILVDFFSKEISKVIKEFLSWENKKSSSVKLIKMPGSDDFIRGFINGLTCTDGYVGDKNITFTSISPFLSQQYASMLDILGIKSRLYAYKRLNKLSIEYYVKIYGRENLEKFEQEVKLSEPIKNNKLENLLRSYKIKSG